jgi:hypothetical protein
VSFLLGITYSNIVNLTCEAEQGSQQGYSSSATNFGVIQR